MFCYNCGKEIMDIAKFCPFCGSKQMELEVNNKTSIVDEENIKNAQDTVDNGKQVPSTEVVHSPSIITNANEPVKDARIYPIGSYSISFDSNEVDFLDCIQPFQNRMVEYEMEFSSYRNNNIKDFDSILEKSLPALKYYMDQMIDFGVDTLLKYSVDYIDHQTFQDELMRQYPIERELEDIFKASQSVVQYAQKLEIESNSGMRFQGGGFGITGAVSGVIKAEMLNMGMDALSGLGKMITGNTNSSKMRRYKEQLFKDLGSKSEITCLHHWCGGVFPIVYKILVKEDILQPVFFDTEKAKAKFNNIVRMRAQNSYSQEKIIVALLDGLKLNPLDIKYCEALFTFLPDSYEDLKKFTSDCGTYKKFFEVAENIRKEHYRQEKINKLKRYTNDKGILENLDNVVINQEELTEWINKKLRGSTENNEISTLYLVDNEYIIPRFLKFMRYVGIGKVIACIDSDTVIKFKSLHITFENIAFDEKYSRLVKSEELRINGMAQLVKKDYEKSIESFMESRDLGNGSASYFLGFIFENGIGVDKDIVKANKFYDEGDSRGDRTLTFTLGNACLKGMFGADISYDRAIFWYEKNDSSIVCLKELADIYAAGLGGHLDPSKASDLYMRAYKLGDYDALRKYAIVSNISLEEKARCFEEATKHGVIDAAYQLGLMHWEHHKEVFHETEKEGYKIAVELFKQEAEYHRDALYKLGEAYLEGKGIARSERLAIDCFRKASDLGQVDAMVELGVCYANGTGVIQNYQKAVELYQSAAEQGNDEAQLNLGICYQYGAGTEKNIEEAAKWYKLSMEQGNTEAKDMLKKLNNQMKASEEIENEGNEEGLNTTRDVKQNDEGISKDEPKTIGEYEKEATDNGNVDAMYKIASMYESGEGVSKDYQKAMEWYQKAADNGSADAMESIGLMYEIGTGVSEDYQKAMEWYQKAADNGNVDAMYKIASMYESGEGVSVDYKKAMEWYQKAADNGSAEAMRLIGIRYDLGEGVSVDHKKAMEWYQKAADNGSAEAMNMIGSMYEYGEFNIWALGKGISVDYQKAMEWYQKAADNGLADAMESIGSMYKLGRGVSEDYKKAMEWYQKGADNGSTNAMRSIGIMYESGEGVSVDYKKAMEWYQKGADNGNADAMYRIGQMYVDGKGISKNQKEGIEWIKKAADEGNLKAKEWLKKRKDGCFITTAVCDSLGKPDDCYELTMFREFRDGWLSCQENGMDLIYEYYDTAPSIVSCINKREDSRKVYREIWDKYLSVCLKYIEENQLNKCRETYVNMVQHLKMEFIDNGK